MAQTLKTADEFLAYRNDLVIGRFMKTQKVSRQEADMVFTELMKFLYVCAHVPASSPPSGIVDEMWHTFIMFTWDYYQFCVEYVGRFLHHQPVDNPYTGNRPEMLELLVGTFGQVDDRYWYHLTRTVPGTPRKGDCDGNYCSENCNANIKRANLVEMRPFMNAGLEQFTASV